MQWQCTLWNSVAYVILCKVSNVSESVLPLQIKRSSFLDIAINLDCHTAITWSERAKPGLRWNLFNTSVATNPSASAVRFEPFTWWFGKHYLRADAECEGRPPLQLIFNATILESDRLVAVISGPAAVSAGCSFTLKSNSYDPEVPGQPLEYQWSCRATNGACSLQSSSAALHVSGGTLLPGTYVIGLNVQRGSAAGSTEMTLKVDHLQVSFSAAWQDGELLPSKALKELNVSVSAGCGEDVTLDNLSLAIMNSSDLHVLDTVRSEENSTFLSLTDSLDLNVLTGSDSFTLLVLKENEIIAQSPSFVLKKPPYGGQIKLEVTGSLFRLETDGWDESDLSYSFYVFPASISSEALQQMNFVDPSSQMYFRKHQGFLASTGPVASLRMAPGNYTAVVLARDRFGQGAIATIPWTVENPSDDDLEAGSTDAFRIMSTVRAAAAEESELLQLLQVAAKHASREAIEEMASVAELVLGSAAGAPLLRTLIGLAKDTGGADKAMAMALLGAIESLTLSNESLELITSLQDAMLPALPKTSGMVLQGESVAMAAGSLCSEAFEKDFKAFILPIQEPCEYSVKASIYKAHPYSDNPVLTSLQLADYPVKSIELVDSADAQLLVSFDLEHKDGFRPYCVMLQASKEWSTSGASGVAGNAQLVCQLRSPGGTVTVANEDLVQAWLGFLRGSAALCFAFFLLSCSVICGHHQFYTKEKYKSVADARDVEAEAVLEEILTVDEAVLREAGVYFAKAEESETFLI